MKILITNMSLIGLSGTTVVTRNLALSLKALGHEPAVYSPSIGVIGNAIRAMGIPVVNDINQLTVQPDIIHGHHSIETATAALRFPDTPAIFVCHDFTAWHDEAPKLPNLTHYVAISTGFRSRLTHQDGIAIDRTSIILNGIDTDLFAAGPALPAVPRRALIYAKNTQHLDFALAACAAHNIDAEAVGYAVNKPVSNGAELMPGYDIIFASGLTAMEAMATGRAVISCDGRGLAGMVTTENYAEWRQQNFGLPTFKTRLSVHALSAAIADYNADNAAAVSATLRQDATLRGWAQQFVDLYEQTIETFTAPSPLEVNAAAAATLQRWNLSTGPHPWAEERKTLQDTLNQLRLSGDAVPHAELVKASDTEYVRLHGFHPTELWGAWSAHKNYGFSFTSTSDVSRLIIKGTTYLCKLRSSVDLAVYINDVCVGRPTITATDQDIELEFPPISGPDFTVYIHGDGGLSPSAMGRSTDTRKIGFGFHAFQIN